MLDSVMRLASLRIRLEPAIRRVLHFYWRFARGATLGVRAAVIDAQGRVFLIRHTYVTGWHLPGGGVETGETLLNALKRELREEGNIELSGPATLHGFYHNPSASRRDHVALYVVRDFRQAGAPKRNYEIAEGGFFAIDALPVQTTRGTQARLEEIFRGAPGSDTW